MIITYHEGACVRVQSGETTIVFGPISKASKNFKPTNFGTDIAFVSFNHPDMNGVAEASRGDREAFAITGPGEYEVHDITAAGFASGGAWNGKPLTNTVYSVHFDDLSILYLGAQAENELPSEVLEMDAPDILITSIGGEGVLSPSDAQKLSVSLEASIVIPILYDEKTLKQFLKEAGQSVSPVEKLTIKRKDIVGKENEVVVLSA
jgi:L-ascorbate metabolism protein UlaG (beta-lactamase superfamily)